MYVCMYVCMYLSIYLCKPSVFVSLFHLSIYLSIYLHKLQTPSRQILLHVQSRAKQTRPSSLLFLLLNFTPKHSKDAQHAQSLPQVLSLVRLHARSTHLLLHRGLAGPAQAAWSQTPGNFQSTAPWAFSEPWPQAGPLALSPPGRLCACPHHHYSLCPWRCAYGQWPCRCLCACAASRASSRKAAGTPRPGPAAARRAAGAPRSTGARVSPCAYSKF